MIYGIGVDIIEIERVSNATKHGAFLKKVYTDSERRYAAARKYAAEVYAGVFAAKEAVAKALGTGFASFSMQDVEIVHDEKHAPYVALHGNAKQLASQHGEYRMLVTISHNRGDAVAQAVWEVFGANDH